MNLPAAKNNYTTAGFERFHQAGLEQGYSYLFRMQIFEQFFLSSDVPAAVAGAVPERGVGKFSARKRS